MNARSALLVALLAVFGAHGLTYILVGVLPDAAVVSLGFESARGEVVAAFHAAHKVRSYTQVLADLARLDLGATLDGIPVSQEIVQGMGASLPRVFLSFLGITTLCILTALYVTEDSGALDQLASFVAFLPPYVMPFLGLLCMLAVQAALGGAAADALTPGMTVVAIGGAPGALIVVQTANIMRRNLASDFARTLVAVGASPLYQRVRLLHNLAAEIVPSIEKMFTSMVAALLFAEPVLGLNGFGTTAIRAIKRSDPDLLLGVTLVLATAVGAFRLGALGVRRHYGLSL